MPICLASLALLWTSPLLAAPPAPVVAEGLSIAVVASVGVEVSLAADGAVASARVVTPSGSAALDEAALAAARSLRFPPPGDGASIVALAIRIAIEPLAAQAADGSVPVPVAVEPVAVEPVAVEPVAVVPGPSVVEDPPTFVSEEVVVVADADEPDEVWQGHALDREVIRILPGSNGDPGRALHNLPGVARPPLGIGQPVVRGTAPEDTGYYVDGVRIPLAFHFGGLTTVINAEEIDRLVFLPGGYGVRYGRTLGGAVELELDEQMPEGTHGYASIDLFQATVFAQKRLGQKRALSISGRRSYADLVLNPFVDNLSASDIRVPRYYDLGARLINTTRRGTVDVLLLLSDDRFRILEGDNEDRTVQIGLATRFARLAVLAREARGPWRHALSVAGSPERQSFELVGGSAVEDQISFGIRDEWARDFPGASGWSLLLGTDTAFGHYRYRSVLPEVADLLGEEASADTLRAVSGAYVEPTLRYRALTVVPGLRADGMMLASGYAAGAVDPRLSTRAAVGATTIEASAGGYSQFPTVRQALEESDLGAQRSWQLSAGGRQALGPTTSVGLTAYRNALRHLVSGREDAFAFFVGPPTPGPLDAEPYTNDGTGWIWGLEGMLRYADTRTVAWLSATYARSRRVARPDAPTRLFTYDQPVVLTALGSRELPKRWRLGLRGRYSSGNPYTPVVNRYLDIQHHAFAPIYGDPDAARLPPFWSIDARVDKEWTLRRLTLAAYLDLQNATNRTNVELIAWSDDYTRETPITGLPILPAFGVRGDF